VAKAFDDLSDDDVKLQENLEGNLHESHASEGGCSPEPVEKSITNIMNQHNIPQVA